MTKINTIIGLACYALVGYALDTLGATFSSWQTWAILVAMMVNEVNECIRMWSKYE